MDSEHRSGSNKDSRTKATVKEAHALSLLISLVDSDDESGSRTDPESNVDDEGTLGQTKRLKSSPSISSTSSDSSLEDLFQMDMKVLLTSASPSSSPKFHGDAQPLVKNDKIDVSSDPSSISEEHDNGSPDVSSSQIFDFTHESLLHTQSPPIQVMERPLDFDPDRIPFSIFASKPSTPMDWSAASNESLFSIHIGNGSFSRDHVFMYGGDLYKSGELYMPEESSKLEVLSKPEELNKSGELNKFRQPSPPEVGGEESSENSLDLGKIVVDTWNNIGPTGVENEPMMDDDSKENHEGEVKFPPPGGSWKFHSNNRHSDSSATSGHSFAFPILSEGGIIYSVKGSPETQHVHPPSPKKPPNTVCSSWFSCFYCSSWFSCFYCRSRSRCR